MSFGKRPARPSSRERRTNPVLQSSLEYEQYLKAKLVPTSDRPSTTGSPSRASDNGRSRPQEQRRRAPLDRPSPPPSYMRGTQSTSRADDVNESKEEDAYDIPIPMQHSWKRMVPPTAPPKPSTDPAVLDSFDFSKVPQNQNDVGT